MTTVFMLPWLLMIAIAGIYVFINYDDIVAEQAALDVSSEEDERLVSKFPKNATDLEGYIVSWYYCSEDTYNRINVGDDIDDYNVAGNDYMYIY